MKVSHTGEQCQGRLIAQKEERNETFIFSFFSNNNRYGNPEPDHSRSESMALIDGRQTFSRSMNPRFSGFTIRQFKKYFSYFFPILILIYLIYLFYYFFLFFFPIFILIYLIYFFIFSPI